MPTTPADRDGCVCRLLPRSRGLPRFAGGSASAPLLSRPAQALLTLRPVGLLNRPRRPLSRSFDPAGCPTKPLVSYQSNRQLSGWNLPPLVKRALGAHRRKQDFWAFRLTNAVNWLQGPQHMPEKSRQNCGLGYARVTTYGQTLAAPLERPRKSGCAKILREQAAGANR